MATNKVCPHCGGQMFMAKIIRACVVEVNTDPNESYKILKEAKDAFDIEILKCARCKADVTENDLVAGIVCKECGKMVGPTDVNEEGICSVCTAIKQRAEIANASREDLIKMLLDAEKKVNPVSVKMEKQIEKAEEVAAPAVETEDTDSSEKAKTPKRKARKKKDDDVATVETTEDTSAEEVVSETVSTEEVVNDIANQQEAPFPDIAMNPPEEVQANEEPVVETPVVSDEQPIGADFHMFDDGEEAF